MSEHLWWYRARLVRVIDADTFELEIDTGFHGRHIERVRLAGVDAPERGTPEGKAAIAYVTAWFEEAARRPSNGWPLFVHTEQVESRHGIAQDMSLGRYIAHVYRVPWDESLAAYLIGAGHGTPWS